MQERVCKNDVCKKAFALPVSVGKLSPVEILNFTLVGSICACKFSSLVAQYPDPRWTSLSSVHFPMLRNPHRHWTVTRKRECVFKVLFLFPIAKAEYRSEATAIYLIVSSFIQYMGPTVGTTQSVLLCFFLSVSRSISFRVRPTTPTKFLRPGKRLTMDINSVPKLVIMKQQGSKKLCAIVWK